MHCSLSCIISYIEDGDWWRAYMIVMWCTISQRMVTCIVNVHPWLWCCPARHVYHMENLLMTHCHWWQTGLHQRQKNLSKHTHTLTHTNTPHTHSLTFPYIYRRFFEQRRHYCHRYLFRVFNMWPMLLLSAPLLPQIPAWFAKQEGCDPVDKFTPMFDITLALATKVTWIYRWQTRKGPLIAVFNVILHMLTWLYTDHPDHSGKTISTLAPCSNYKGSIGGKTNMRCFRQGSIIWQPELESHIILD